MVKIFECEFYHLIFKSDRNGAVGRARCFLGRGSCAGGDGGEAACAGRGERDAGAGN